MGHLYQLQRFVEAQQPVFGTVCNELRAGKKTSHWIWFVFPQIAGLGTSETARRYAISSLDEAQAYLRHPLLGDRLAQCSALVLASEGKSAAEIFGYPDELKYRSSMTLFARAALEEGKPLSVLADCLRKYYGGHPDASTLAYLSHLTVETGCSYTAAFRL